MPLLSSHPGHQRPPEKHHQVPAYILTGYRLGSPHSLQFTVTMTGPNFIVPAGTQTVQVRIIDSTTRIGKLPANFLMKPPVHGLQYMPVLPAWSFLIEHASGRKVLFDLGVPKDYYAFSPTVTKHLERQGWEVSVDKDVIDILEENGLAPCQISSIIWR